MAIEYCLVCNTCKEFLDIHKLRIIPQKCEQSPLGLRGISINPVEIEEGIENLAIQAENKDHEWILALLPYVEKFRNEHALHQMSMVDDAEPDYCWWPEHSGYTGWREIPTSLENELFLPRNLVYDLQITDWPTAEKHLQSLQVVLYDELELTEYENTFRKLTALSNSKD
jgi:hypothetical protein